MSAPEAISSYDRVYQWAGVIAGLLVDIAFQLNVQANELARQRRLWKPPKPRYTCGVLAKYMAQL
jgi:hypothetical protein